jgi:GTP-binding protein SAR1
MSFLYDMWRSLWSSLWSALGLRGKEGTLLLLGLDNAGKTTLLHRLRTGGVRNFPPTDRPSSETFAHDGVTFRAWDLGGHEAVRHLWEDYVCECKAVLFLVDASDSERIEEVGYELDALIAERVVADLPIAILFNKCDLHEAMSSEEMCQRIQYSDLERMQGPEKMASFRISVLRGEGYQEAFRWISKFL